MNPFRTRTGGNPIRLPQCLAAALALVLVAGTAAALPIEPMPGAYCPDTSLSGRFLANTDPWCNLLAPDLLFTVAYGLTTDASGRLGFTTARASRRRADLDRGERYLGRFAVAEHQCFLTTPGNPPHGADESAVSSDFMDFGDLFRTDCRPMPGSWQRRITHVPALHGLVVAMIRQLQVLGRALNLVTDEDRRLEGIFGTPRVKTPNPNPNLGFVDEEQRLAGQVRVLAATARHFFSLVEGPLTGRGGSDTLDRISARIEAALPGPAGWSYLSLDERTDAFAALFPPD